MNNLYADAVRNRYKFSQKHFRPRQISPEQIQLNNTIYINHCGTRRGEGKEWGRDRGIPLVVMIIKRE